MCACVWPCESSIVCVFQSGCGSWPERSPGGPLASLPLVERGVEEISPHPPCSSPIHRAREEEEIRACFPMLPRRQEPAREDAFNFRLAIGSAWENYRRCRVSGETKGWLRTAVLTLRGKSHYYHGSGSTKAKFKGWEDIFLRSQRCPSADRLWLGQFTVA